MAILALDHGEARIGVAVTDPSGTVPLGLPNVETDDSGGEIDEIAKIVRQREVTKIVIGLPKQMDGSEGQRARRVRGFAKKLKLTMPELQYEFVDERFTSTQAKRAMGAGGIKRNESQKKVDRVAAQFILRRYCDGENMNFKNS